MSRVEELIKEYCPNGVEYKKINDISIIKRGKRITKKQIKENGKYPIVSGGISFFGRFDEFNRKANTITISSYGSAGYVNYITEDFWANDVCLCVYPKDYKKLNNKYLYYCLKNNQNYLYKNTTKAIPDHIETRVILELKIPVPSLPVQEEIVRILDSFTKLTTELTTELTKRKKQYEYYRDTLLIKQSKYKNVKLNTVCEIYDGTHQTPNYTENGIPFVSVENIENLFGTNKYISENDHAKYKIKPCKGDVFMTRIGSIGKCAIMECNKDLAYYVSLALLRPNKNILNSHYLKHYLESESGKKELAKRTLTNAVPIKINKIDIGKINIIIPPIEIQSKIAETLDNFESICSNLNIGLPAEIEARKKQYEYYRNKLLTFNESVK